MYEDQTYETILQRMLDSVPNNVDKREGSIIYNALAPAAAELTQMYIELDSNVSLGFGTSAAGEYLDLRAADYGVTRRQATKAIRLGLFYDGVGSPLDVPIGSRFSIAGINYTALEAISTGQFRLECETPGVIGNQHFGTLLPIEFIDGLAQAELTDILIPGEDVESDEEFRLRYLQRIQTPSTSGNIADYMNWSLEVQGVGAAQVFPLWNGSGTVKVVLLGTDKLPATQDVVDAAQAYIDPVAAEGEGKAPIGAEVTVASASAVQIDVSATIVLTGEQTLQEVIDSFTITLSEYLQSIAFSADPHVRYVRVGSMLLDTPGVSDYSNLLVNGGSANITINAGEVATVGTVTFSE